ncbi:MAG: hypothetical protein KDK70_02650 [Myxococcales bacterium]|nr:hypothetical protein [Myxococcales bacterium]
MSPIRIRSEQLHTLTRDGLAARRAGLLAELQVRHPGRAPGELEELVELGITRGELYGLRQRAALLGYLELLVEHGPSFDQGVHGQRNRQLLSAAAIPERSRVATVAARLDARRRHRAGA